MAQKNIGGILFESIVPGEFYRSTDPGGFTDRITGIHIPGPKVRLSEDGARTIESISELPAPVQLPHFKMIFDSQDKDRKIQTKTKVPFDRRDEYPLCDALNMALGTGIIQHVTEEEMKKRYPKLWENRKSEYIYSDEQKVARPMQDLFDEYYESVEREDTARRTAEDLARREADRKALEALVVPDEVYASDDDEEDDSKDVLETVATAPARRRRTKGSTPPPPPPRK